MKSEHRPIAAETPRAIEDLAEMIAVDTEFPPGAGYTAFADLAEPWLYALGMEARRVVVPEPLWRTQLGGAHGYRVNLLGVRRTGRPICSIYVHVDTLPAAADWTLPPLRLIRIGNRLHGLGAADTKGALAAALLALRAAERAGVALAYDPALLLCTDEENGLHPGVRHLAEQRLIEGHIVNLNGAAAARIWAGCFGSFDLAIRLRGAAAHAGDAARGGANAIEAGLPVLAALDRLRPLIAARHSAMPAHPDATGPLAGRLSITSAHDGTGGSSLPAVFDIVVNRRYAAEERFEEALEEIEAAVRAAAPRAETELSRARRPNSSVICHPSPTRPARTGLGGRRPCARGSVSIRRPSLPGVRRVRPISAGCRRPAPVRSCSAG